MTLRMKETNCLQCGWKLNAIGDFKDEACRAPKPGDPILCLRCGAAMTCGADLALRGFTDAEMDELIADREVMGELARCVTQIHWLRHADG